MERVRLPMALVGATNPLPTLRTTSSLAQRVTEAKGILARPTNATEASRAAKQLTGQYAHLRPDNPETFIASIAAVLAQYPLGLVEECCDPRRGLARKSEFLSVKAVVDWCDVRLSFYQGFAGYVAPKVYQEPELTDEERGRGLAAWRGLQKTINENGAEAARALSFDDAAKIGAEGLTP